MNTKCKLKDISNEKNPFGGRTPHPKTEKKEKIHYTEETIERPKSYKMKVKTPKWVLLFS